MKINALLDNEAGKKCNCGLRYASALLEYATIFTLSGFVIDHQSHIWMMDAFLLSGRF